MYLGRIVEIAGKEELFARPLHPYTRGLLASIPKIERVPAPTLPEIPGMVPGAGDRPRGCAFMPRCARAVSGCAAEPPPLAETGPGHRVACWNPADG